MLEAFITNLGRYNEGYLDGAYLKLPATTSELQALLGCIHVDGIRYEEVFITDYETDISGLYDYLGEYESIDELNYLAFLLEDMQDWERDKFSAALELGEHTGSTKDLINLAQNLDCFEYYPDIEDEEDLGRYYIEEMCALEVPDHLRNYIDYEAYGRDMNLDENGNFVNGGYIVRNGDSFAEYYNNRDDLPEEYHIFAYPAPEKSVQKLLASYQQTISEAPTAPDRPRSDKQER